MLPKHLLVATDFSSAARQAVAVAAMLAQRVEASIMLFHAYDPAPLGRATPFIPFHMKREDIEREAGERVHEELARLRSELLESVPQVTLEARLHKSAAMAVCAVAEERGVDLVVIGRRGHASIKELLIGGNAEKVVRHAPASVLAVAQEQEDFALGELLVAVDFSPPSLYACQVAAAWAEAFGARLTLVHVVAPARMSAAVPVAAAPLPLGTPLPIEPVASTRQAIEAAHRSLESVRDERCRAAPSVTVDVLEHPSVHDAIAARAQQGADLVVLGSAGHRGLERVLLGSVAEKVVRQVPCSTLVVRPLPARSQ